MSADDIRLLMQKIDALSSRVAALEGTVNALSTNYTRLKTLGIAFGSAAIGAGLGNASTLVHLIGIL